MALSKPDLGTRPGPYSRRAAVDVPLARRPSVESNISRRGSADSFVLLLQVEHVGFCRGSGFGWGWSWEILKISLSSFHHLAWAAI